MVGFAGLLALVLPPFGLLVAVSFILVIRTPRLIEKHILTET